MEHRERRRTQKNGFHGIGSNKHRSQGHNRQNQEDQSRQENEHPKIKDRKTIESAQRSAVRIPETSGGGAGGRTELQRIRRQHYLFPYSKR